VLTDDTRSSALSPSAAVALLTLQLRAALREADTAETAVDAINLDRARADLRVQLDAITAERRNALNAAMAAELDAADDMVASARAEAAAIISAARAQAAELDARVEASSTEAARVAPVEIRAVAPAADPRVMDDISDVIETVEFAPVVDETAETSATSAGGDEAELRASVETALATVVSQSPSVAHWSNAPQVGSSLSSGDGPTISIDAEAFARVFATVLGTVLDERFAEWRSTAPAGVLTGQPLAGQPLVVTTPANRPLWRRVLQLDAILMTLAAAILVVLIFAWLG
jgi:hypothetical protein